MQRYQSHKIVEAGKITAYADPNDPEMGMLIYTKGNEDGTRVTREVFDRLRLMAKDDLAGIIGGYLVVYEDGYVSWSPADAFEKGYSLVQPSSGKSKIAGYRELSEDEISAMNAVKALGPLMERLVSQMRADPNLDQRWVSIGATDLQTGLMALTRAIAKPEFF